MNLKLQTVRARLGAVVMALPRSSQRTVRAGRESRPGARLMGERNQATPAPDGLVPSGANGSQLVQAQTTHTANIEQTPTGCPVR
jgi:hypothetical protein